MEKTLPVYNLIISPDDNDITGVDAVALVDDPAIKRTFLAFKSDPEPLKFAGETEQKIISGPLMIPNLPIYRNDPEHGDHYVIFSRETIRNIVYKFFRQKRTSDTNAMHDPLQPCQGVYMIESMIIDSSRGIKAPEQFGYLAEGSWFGSFKVDNDEIWNNFIKSGTFQGFSVEGMFDYKFNSDSSEERLNTTINAVLGFNEEINDTETLNAILDLNELD